MNTGVIIPLAYPEEFVAMVPGWYRKPLEWIGVVNHGLICAGHSALVLIDKSTGILEYSDFGRYIAPVGKGRTRSMYTDPEVEFEIKALFDENGKLTNVLEILHYIEANPEKTHGGGTMYASVAYEVNYDAAKAFVSQMNKTGSMPYDPFRKGSSNCSRYVHDAIQAGLTNKYRKFNHYFANIFTPSPLGNVFYAAKKEDIFYHKEGDWKLFNRHRSKEILKHFFLKPENREKKSVFKEKPTEHAQWLGGIGAGAWFDIKKNNESDTYKIRRYFKNGELIFEKDFMLVEGKIDLESKYQFAYDSHALKCTILQDNKKALFKAI
jgi:hypothetical protein